MMWGTTPPSAKLLTGDSGSEFEATLIGFFSVFGGKLAPTPFGTFATLSALFGDAAVVAECPLLRDERTKLRRGPRSEFDPDVWSGRALQVVSPSWR